MLYGELFRVLRLLGRYGWHVTFLAVLAYAAWVEYDKMLQRRSFAEATDPNRTSVLEIERRRIREQQQLELERKSTEAQRQERIVQVTETGAGRKPLLSSASATAGQHRWDADRRKDE